MPALGRMRAPPFSRSAPRRKCTRAPDSKPAACCCSRAAPKGRWQFCGRVLKPRPMGPRKRYSITSSPRPCPALATSMRPCPTLTKPWPPRIRPLPTKPFTAGAWPISDSASTPRPLPISSAPPEPPLPACWLRPILPVDTSTEDYSYTSVYCRRFPPRVNAASTCWPWPKSPTAKSAMAKLLPPAGSCSPSTLPKKNGP